MLFPHLSRRGLSASDGCHGWSRWGLACCRCRCFGASWGIYGVSSCAFAPSVAIDSFALTACWQEWSTFNTVRRQEEWITNLFTVKQCQFSPQWVHAPCVEPESFFILEEITAKKRNNRHIMQLDQYAADSVNLTRSVLTWEGHTDILLVALSSGDLWPHGGSWFWSARFQSERSRNTQTHKAHFIPEWLTTCEMGFMG